MAGCLVLPAPGYHVEMDASQPGKPLQEWDDDSLALSLFTHGPENVKTVQVVDCKSCRSLEKED